MLKRRTSHPFISPQFFLPQRFRLNCSFVLCLAYVLNSTSALAASSVTHSQEKQVDDIALQLPESVRNALQKAEVPSNALAALVISLDGKESKLSLQAQTSMSPASTMKLLSTFIALDELGPVFRWKTRLLSERPLDALLEGKTLKASLYLQGGGAPDLNWERLGAMLRGLQAKGVRHLRGNIILDRNYFTPTRFDLGRTPFDEFPDAYYNVIPDALLVNSNLTSFSIDANDNNIVLSSSPPVSKLKINNQLMLSDMPCSAWETAWKTPKISTNIFNETHILLSGQFPRNCKVNTELNLLDRNAYIEHLIRRLWEEMGGTWRGHVLDGTTPATAQLLVEQKSETLADNLRIINKRSDNAMTRLLYLTLGAEAKDRLSNNTSNTASTSFTAAELRVRQWFNKNQLDDAGLVLENGSGLSRTERITASQLAGILQIAAKSNWYPEFSASLPIVGVDGTMRRRLIGSKAEQRARMKTGTLRDTTAVAGYVKDQNDQTWIVVAMLNHPNAGKGRPALDALIEWVANAQAGAISPQLN